MMLKQEQAKLVASSIGNIMNGSSSSPEKESVVAANVDIPVVLIEPKTVYYIDTQTSINAHLITAPLLVMS
ncbi:hypothetical protein RJT34_12272 [Clitoria ternatea]|uniref:Uncharacterized protein n=1 Tax=Clitoria ternatea TaxID=43366 RepID=A0AAN9JP52_CLITE